MKIPFLDGISKIGRVLGNLEKWLLVCLVIFLIGFSVLQIILRNFFATGYPWADTLLRHVVLWVSLLGAARATAEDKHIRIDLVPRLLPGGSARTVALVTQLFSLCVSAALLSASWTFIRDESLSGSFAFDNVPLWWFETIFPITFAIMTLRFAYSFLETLNGNPGQTEVGQS